MRIQYNSLSNVAVSCFKESTLPSPTPMLNKIRVIVGLAFVCLAILYVLYNIAKEKKSTIQQYKELKAAHGGIFKTGTLAHEYFNKLDDKAKNTLSDGKIIEEGETKNGKLHGPGRRISPSGDVWEGEFKDGNLNGKGKRYCLNGLDEGDFKDDKLNGYGKVTFTDGNVWEGEFKDNMMNGPGKRLNPNGDIVEEGEFKNNTLIKGKKYKSNTQPLLIHGKEVPSKPDDILFQEGEFGSGSNQCIKIYVNGSTEQGVFTHGNLQKGKRISPDGTIEKGSFKYFYKHLQGPGKRIHRDGKIEKGEFVDGVLNGQGKITFADGKVLEGQFKNGCLIEGTLADGKLNGQGKKTFIDGKIEEGVFKDDQLEGQGKRTHANGAVEEGVFKYGALIDGKFKRGMELIEEGQFKCSLLDGQGKRTLSNLNDGGDVAEESGEFVKGKLHGEGKRIYAGGKIEEGKFEKGKFVA